MRSLVVGDDAVEIENKGSDHGRAPQAPRHTVLNRRARDKRPTLFDCSRWGILRREPVNGEG